jgi:hypothetical protein
MCLACEMDALWFVETAAAARATPGTAGVAPALENDPVSLVLGFSERVGEAPAVPSEVPTSPGERGQVRRPDEMPAFQASRFRCEETGS